MATILHMTYKAGQSWNAKIAEWFPEARPGNIPQDIHIILDCGSGIIRSIATEVKDEDSDLHNTLKGTAKVEKLQLNFKSHISAENLGLTKFGYYMFALMMSQLMILKPLNLSVSAKRFSKDMKLKTLHC